MNDEKILAYFNIDSKTKFDSFLILIFAGLDLGISVFYFFQMLFRMIPMTTTFVVLGIFGVAIDVSFMIVSKFTTNPVMEYPMSFFLALSSTIKSGISACLAYPAEREVYEISVGVEYLAITITAILLAIVVIREKNIGLRLIKTHPIDEARRLLANRKINKWVFPGVCLPGGSLFLYRLLRNRVYISITLCCWGGASVCLFFLLLTGYNMIMVSRFKLYQVWKRNHDKIKKNNTSVL